MIDLPSMSGGEEVGCACEGRGGWEGDRGQVYQE